MLNQVLGREQQLPECNPLRLEAVLSACPGLEFIMDGTERPVNRPKDREIQRKYYSGKKKTHTVNNNLISQRGGKVLYLSDTYEGSVHDKVICDLDGIVFPPGSKLWKDRGYQGYEPEGMTTFQPEKKLHRQVLSEADQDWNRRVSSERVEIEHQINGIKRSSDCGASVAQSASLLCRLGDGDSLWITQLSLQSSAIVTIKSKLSD